MSLPTSVPPDYDQQIGFFLPLSSLRASGCIVKGLAGHGRSQFDPRFERAGTAKI